MAAAAKSIEEIVTQMRMQLAARGGEASMAALGRAFKVADSDKSGKLSPEEFGRVLNRCGIFLPVADLQRVIKHFDTDGDGEITYQEFLKGLAGKLNKRRQAMVDMAFEVMDTDKSGVIDAADVKDRYDASHHPKVISGEKTKEQVLKEFLMTMEGDHGNMDGEITREEWNDYYTGISASIMYNDDYFCMMMEKVWGIKESPNNAISEEEVKRLKAIIKEKAHQKAKGNTSERITAMQTFKHFDTDNSGEINFAEFSQALERFGVVMDKGKATALFGAFDKAGKGKISYQEFVNALYAEEAALEEARLKALKAAAPAPAKK